MAKQPQNDGITDGEPTTPQTGGDQLAWEEIDFQALDRANNRIGRENAEAANADADEQERAELMADILGGLGGEDAIAAVDKPKK